MPIETERSQGEVRMSKSTQWSLKWALAGAMLGVAAPAAAQTVLIVPYAQQNPALQLGIAVAKRAYKFYLGLLSSPRWMRAYNAGARPQRLLWARLCGITRRTWLA